MDRVEHAAGERARVHQRRMAGAAVGDMPVAHVKDDQAGGHELRSPWGLETAEQQLVRLSEDEGG